MSEVVHKYKHYMSGGVLKAFSLIGTTYCGVETVYDKPLTAWDVIVEPNCEECLSAYALDALAGVGE